MPQRLLRWQQYVLRGATHKIVLTGVLSCMAKKETDPCILEPTMGAMTHCHIHCFSHVGRLVGIIGCRMFRPPMIPPNFQRIILDRKKTGPLNYIQVLCSLLMCYLLTIFKNIKTVVFVHLSNRWKLG